MKRLSTLGFIFTFLLIANPAAADWAANTTDKRQVKAASAIEKIRSTIPRAEQYFEQAYAYAILPSVTRIGFGFGGATGKGIVIEGDNAIGKTRFWQFTSGIQAGAKNFSMIVFFKDKEALDKFKSGDIQFMGQAGVAFANVGLAGTPAYNNGVAIVTMTRFGLMGEFTISGAKFSYKTISVENQHGT
jgi:lipid-binding SYLF domain-containing protein